MNRNASLDSYPAGIWRQEPLRYREFSYELPSMRLIEMPGA